MFLLPENLLKGSVATDQDSRLSWNEHTRTSVKFMGEEEEERVIRAEDEDVRVSVFSIYRGLFLSLVLRIYS